MDSQEKDSDLIVRYELKNCLKFHQSDVCTLSILHNCHVASGGGDGIVYLFDCDELISSMKGFLLINFRLLLC